MITPHLTPGKISFVSALFVFSLQLNAQFYPPYSVTALDTSASHGYYFCVPFKKGTTHFSDQMILDDKGRVVYTKYFTGPDADDFKIQPNGLMSYAGAGQFYLMDSTFTIVDSVSCVNGILTDTHDLQILPNGHYLILGYEHVIMNLTAYHLFNNNGSPGSPNANVRCGVIQELDANHNVVFEWHTKDHFSFGDVDSFFLFSPSVVDWTHCNAVDLDQDGNILLSSRHLDEITKINRSDSSIMWRMGGNANQFTFTNDMAMFRGQHDIRRIANGHLTMNDNGRTTVHPGSGKEYQVDEIAHTATLVWSFTDDSSTSSLAMGNCQRLSNGNTLIDNGNLENEQLAFNVVDSTGHKIFEIAFDDSLRTYRAFNYLTLPWALHRPQITCFTSGNQLYLDAGPGYSSYLWSNGTTTQTVAVTTADTFNVFVPYGQGGYISSDYLYIADPLTYCTPLNTGNISATDFTLSPNPASDRVSISFPAMQDSKAIVEIFDCTGKKMHCAERDDAAGKMVLDISEFPEGIYFVRVNGTVKKFVKI